MLVLNPSGVFVRALRLAIPPEPFANPHQERLFQARVRIGAVRAELAGLILGLLFVAGILVIRQSDLNDSDVGRFIQALRGVVFLILLCGFLFIVFRPRLYVRNHTFFLASILLSCSIVFCMILVRLSLSGVPGATLMMLSAVVVIWLMFGLAYLNSFIILVILFPVNCGVVFAVSLVQPLELVSIYFHLGLVNIIGFVSRSGVERRDRRLFVESWRLRRAKMENMRRQLELESLNAQKERMVQFVAHDLRQPLASLGIYSGLLESLVKKHGQDESYIRVLGSINACVFTMQANIERLLLPLSGENGVRQSFPVESVSLRQTINSVVQLVEPAAKKGGVRLRVFVGGRVGADIITNKGVLMEILVNLLDNSIKYRTKRPEVVPVVLIGVVKLRGMCRISIVDNGLGIDAANLENIFIDNWRADSGDKSVRGLGLGLASVRSSIQALPSHRIGVSSRVQVGSRFSLWVPLVGQIN